MSMAALGRVSAAAAAAMSPAARAARLIGTCTTLQR